MEQVTQNVVVHKYKHLVSYDFCESITEEISCLPWLMALQAWYQAIDWTCSCIRT